MTCGVNNTMASQREVYHWFFTPFRDWSLTYEHCHRCTKNELCYLFQLDSAPIWFEVEDPFYHPHNTFLCKNCWKNIILYNVFHPNYPRRNKFDGRKYQRIPETDYD